MAAQRVGIRDVAAEAGVSVTTVSHILNNYASLRASPETKQRVHEAAARLGYGPNRMARGLRIQRSEMIGLLSEQVATAPHAGRIILGAQAAARRHGLTLVLINTDAEDLQRDADTLLRQQVDGVLYATMYHREIELPSQLARVPTVLIDSEDKALRTPAVIPDERGGAETAMQELLDAGHRRIGFITNVDDVPATRDRLAGYRGSLAEAGVPFDPDLVTARVSETPGGYAAARHLLLSDTPPTAIFAYNDRMAMGAYRAAAELGLRIPLDLSIVGFDNQEILAEGLYPSLTTVALPHYEMGDWAVDELVRQIESRWADEVDPEPDSPQPPAVLACPLVRRESVAPPGRAAAARR